MTGAELARAVANVAWEVLQTLTTALKPWAMEDLSSRVGVPPIDLGADWTAAVEQARVDLDGLEGAAWVGRVAALADLLVARFRDLQDAGSEVELLARLRPFVALALLLAMAKDAERNWIEEAVVWVAAALLLLDVRVQESFLGASPVHRSEAGPGALLVLRPRVSDPSGRRSISMGGVAAARATDSSPSARRLAHGAPRRPGWSHCPTVGAREAYATDEVKAAGTLMGAAWGVDKLVRLILRRTSLPPSHWRWGFDVPAPSVSPPRIQSGGERCARKTQQAPCRPRRIVGSRSREYWCR